MISSIYKIWIYIQSIYKKIDKLKILCRIYKPDFLCISESWLNSSHSDIELDIENYLIHRTDRHSGKYGGVVIFERKNSNFNCQRIDKNLCSNENIEFIILEIKKKLCKPFYLSSFYCSPISTNFMKEKFVEIFADFFEKECLFVGDFNIDVNKSDNKKWFELMENNSSINRRE